MKKIIFLLILFLLIPNIVFGKVYITTNTNIIPSSMMVNTYYNQTKQIEDWGIKLTNVKRFWSQGYTGKGVKIALIDSGVAINHPDLKGAIAGGVSFVPYTTSYNDDNGHGTHVAGIIAAQNNSFGSVGIAYGAKIYALKAMDKDGNGIVPNLVKAIRWSINNHMNIINLSCGLSDDEIGDKNFYALKNIITEAYNKGIFIVASAGNDGVGKVVYPANFPEAIAVGATYDSCNSITGKCYPVWIDFSNYGRKIEVVAPGTFVFSTYPTNLTPFFYKGTGYEFMSGTSMAAPYVSGFLAILKQKYPHDSMWQLRQKLHYYTKMPTPMPGKYGYGFIYAK